MSSALPKIDDVHESPTDHYGVYSTIRERGLSSNLRVFAMFIFACVHKPEQLVQMNKWFAMLTVKTRLEVS